MVARYNVEQGIYYSSATQDGSALEITHTLLKPTRHPEIDREATMTHSEVHSRWI